MKNRIENKYINVNKSSTLKIIASEHFFENVYSRKISVGIVRTVMGIMAQKSFPKDSITQAEKFILSDGYDAILVSRISADKIMLINAFKSKSIKEQDGVTAIKVPLSNMIIKPSKHFVERFYKREVDLDLISAVDKQIYSSSIGQPYVVSDGTNTVIATKISHTSILLNTCYISGEMDWDDFLDKKIA